LVFQDTNGNDWYYWPGTDGTLRFADAATAEASGFNFNTGGTQIGAGIALTSTATPGGGKKMGETGQEPGHSTTPKDQPARPGHPQGQPGEAPTGPKDIKSDDPNKREDPSKDRKTEDPNKPATPNPVQERPASGPGQTTKK
jgi:hypothetical protein